MVYVMNEQTRLRLKTRDKLFKLHGEPTNMEELALFVVNVSNHLKTEKQLITGIAWSVTSRHVSNTHHSPITGVKNWRGDHNLPRSYNGFYGRLWIRKNGEDEFISLSERIAKSFTYTGSGGGGSYNGPWGDLEQQYIKHKGLPESRNELRLFSWDYRFYTDDFPFLLQYEEDKLFVMMQGSNKEPEFKSEVFWESEDVKKKDEIFRKEYLI